MLKLIIHSIIYYRKQHIGTILAIAMCTTILTGAFIIGDSVRGSLRDMVTERLGNTSYALELDHRYIKTRIADKLADRLGTTVAPLLCINGVLRNPEGTNLARSVRINGIDFRFAQIANNSKIYENLADDEILINEPLARQLNLNTGDEIVLRFTDSGFLPGDTPIAGNVSNIIAGRYKISGIVNTEQLGHFNLRINQVATENVFISLSALGRELNLNDYANTVLIAGNGSDKINEHTIFDALKSNWDISDAGFDLVFLDKKNKLELRSKSIFIDKDISQAIINSDSIYSPVLTYFINTISNGTRSTPYSFVSAIGAPIIPPEMTESEIIINQWLADDLNIETGDSLSMTYFVPGPNNALHDESRTFKVRSIVPLSGIYADRELMPGFPGLADVDNCRYWDPGIPIDLDLIRNKDEDYWSRYRGTPKAFVTLPAAREMWQNRFGNCTAIRINSTDLKKIKHDLSGLIHPEKLGINFAAARQEGLNAGNQSVDFSELFLGLSFFMIVSSLLLTSLIYRLNIDNRVQETGLYFALGFRASVILKIMLYEGIFLAFIASALGSFLSILYTQFVLESLNTVWQGAIGTSAIRMHLTSSSIIAGFIISIFIVVLTIIVSLYRYSRADTGTLQRAAFKPAQSKKSKRGLFSLILGILCIGGALIIIFITDAGRGKEAVTSFFASGFLTLTGGLALTNFLFIRQESGKSFYSIYRLAFRNSSRNRTRSLILVGMLASSLFIVFTVGANRSGDISDMSKRESGTGGFMLFGETTFPVNYDLNVSDGKKLLTITDSVYQDVKFAQFQLREGDDASCLNLNRISEPKILGVEPTELLQRNAFSFHTKIPEIKSINPWHALDDNYGDNVIPGIADETVIIWGLGKSVGDTVSYLDEKGMLLRIKLIAGLTNSIFQGHIIISGKNFLHHFPSVSGYRIFLVDTDVNHLDPLTDKLSWSLQDYGLNLQTTAQRLAGFSKVENTYLSIFLILGSFAIILGTLGIGIVVFRNVLERKNELAIMRAVGFESAVVRKVVFIEHSWLLLLGIFIGLAAAMISIIPALLSSDADTPIFIVIVFLVSIFTSGLIWTYLATNRAVSSNLMESLRND